MSIRKKTRVDGEEVETKKHQTKILNVVYTSIQSLKDLYNDQLHLH